LSVLCDTFFHANSGKIFAQNVKKNKNIAILASSEEQSRKFSIEEQIILAVNELVKIAVSATQHQTTIWLHAYFRTAAAPNCMR